MKAEKLDILLSVEGPDLQNIGKEFDITYFSTISLKCSVAAYIDYIGVYL